MLLRIGGGVGGGERRAAAAAAAAAAVLATGSAAARRSAAASASASTSARDPPQLDPHHRSRVLSLFRSILREARGMPTANRRAYIERRARAEFREGAAAAAAGGGPASSERAAFLVALAETQLESAQVQRRLLNELKRKGQLKS